jgi:NADPH-dependent 2,4-dienoyl-CoA reductase/sulfur reductase-like enzyme
MRFAVEVVRAVRERAGADFIIVFRLSMLDLVEGGGTFDETVRLAQAIEAAGATIINTGIGWHEARIPTIATPVPRAAFSWVTRKLKGKVSIPLVTTNRINDPQVADDVISRGDADMVSMARPFLADAELLSKAQSGRADEINWAIWDPYYSAALLQGGVKVLKDGETLKQTGSFYLAARPYAEKNGEFVQGVLNTFSEADALTQSQRQASITLLAKTMGLPEPVIASYLDHRPPTVIKPVDTHTAV